MDKHDKSYMRIALEIASRSYARKKQVGCILVKNNMIISDGYNGMPSGFVNDCENEISGGPGATWTELVTKPEVLHAESNAITKMAKSTQSSNGATMYCTWAPCVECSKLIIQAGIKRLVYGEKYRKTAGVELLEKAKIVVEFLSIESL